MGMFRLVSRAPFRYTTAPSSTIRVVDTTSDDASPAGVAKEARKYAVTCLALSTPP